MRQFKSLRYENHFWILEFYDEDEKLIQEQFINLDTYIKDYMENTLGFSLNFEPPSNN
jgi:hypothetical protein